MIIRMRHIRACHMCSGGARTFFARHNLNWNTFLKDGLPEEDIIATKDEMALDVVRVAQNG